ncbi:hypothetical protein OXIME_000773 [Oxyplasma meridianum]|uniref:Glycosyltransferase family 2 protein n=1 Tax=Oxyplasma meridianum TaxID=3073602 RepID=A0AAX4NGC6_9ARCH
MISKEINLSALHTNLNIENNELFFSLVDYRNNLFMSNDPQKIIEFYNSFENREQLIQWMKERPKGVCYIKEIEGDKDIIVVIPTVDINGKYAIQDKDIFKGLHIIFVESGAGNYYFNYAHNCNVGIKKAMEYNPKWIIVSNDDMYKIDNISILKKELNKLNFNEKKFVHTYPAKYHSRYAYISNRTFRRSFILSIYKNYRKKLKIESFLKIKYVIGTSSGIKRFLYNNKIKILYSGAITILSYGLIKNLECKIFDENYVNGAEDIDLAIKLKLEKVKYNIIDFKIKDIVGGTLGSYGDIRTFREICNLSYLNTKIVKNNLFNFLS